MLELLETLLTTTSLFYVIGRLAELTITDMMVIFLLSKPLFMIIAIGALFGGRKWGDSHYLHHQDCDRFLSQSFSTGDDTCRRIPRRLTIPSRCGKSDRHAGLPDRESMPGT